MHSKLETRSKTKNQLSGQIQIPISSLENVQEINIIINENIDNILDITPIQFVESSSNETLSVDSIASEILNTSNMTENNNPNDPNSVSLMMQNSAVFMSNSSLHPGFFSGDNSESATDFMERFSRISTSLGWPNEIKIRYFALTLNKVATQWFSHFEQNHLQNPTYDNELWETLKKDFLRTFDKSGNNGNVFIALRNKTQGLTEPVEKYFYSTLALIRKYEPN